MKKQTVTPIKKRKIPEWVKEKIRLKKAEDALFKKGLIRYKTIGL